MTGEDIRRMRQEMGLEQIPFAYLIDTRQKDVSRWESGKVKPGPKYQRRIQALYDSRDTIETQRRIAIAILDTL